MSRCPVSKTPRAVTRRRIAATPATQSARAAGSPVNSQKPQMPSPTRTSFASKSRADWAAYFQPLSLKK